MTKTSTQWVLDRILALDEVRPGLAGQFLRASNERRNVIAAYVAKVPRSLGCIHAEAELLATGKHDAILTAAYGSSPSGFRATLGRAGSRTHPRRFYIYLHALLASNYGTEVLAVLSQQPKLDLVRLRVMRVMPTAIRTPRIVAIHRDIEQARQTASLFWLMLDNGVDADGLVQAIRASETPGALARCWRRSMEKLNFPSPPIQPSEHYRPIRNGGELRGTALGFRNCMRRFLTDALEGDHAFGVLRTPTQEIVIHLRRRDDVWYLDDCHARGNRAVPKAAAAAAADFLRGHGIVSYQRKRTAASKWEPLRDMIARWDFDHDHGTDWG